MFSDTDLIHLAQITRNLNLLGLTVGAGICQATSDIP
jgi:hypothetical protein